MKTWKKIVRIVVLAMVIIPTAALIAVQIPAVQTRIVNKVTETLSKNLDGRVEVGRVLISFPNNIILKDVNVIQGAGDTIATLGKALVSLKTTSLVFSEQALVRRVSLEDGSFTIRHLTDSTTNLSALLAPMPHNESGELVLPWDEIRVNKVTLKNIDFSTVNPFTAEEGRKRNPRAIDWKNIGLQDINLTVRDLSYGKALSGRIADISLKEKNGLEVKHVEGDVTMDDTGIHISGLEYNDGWSDLHADNFELGFTDFSDFSDFVNKVRLSGTFRNTFFDARTLQYYAGMNEIPAGLWIDGKAEGTVNDLRSDGLRVRSDSKGTDMDLRFHLKDITDPARSRISAEILRSSTSTADLANIISAVSPGFKRSSITGIAHGEAISLRAKAEGPLDDLKVTGHLGTGTMGSATFDAMVGTGKGGVRVDGTASTESLQLGRLLGNPSLGALTCQTELEFSSSKKNGLVVGVAPLKIDNFIFNGYDYRGILASGRLKGDRIDADFFCNDPNISIIGHGDIVLGGKGQNNSIKLDIDLNNADLTALNFDKREDASVSFALDADLLQTPQGAILGHADFRSLQATLQGQQFDIGDLSFNSEYQDERYLLDLNSTVAKANYEGNLFITKFVSRVMHLIVEDNLEQLLGRTHDRSEDFPHPEDYGSLRLRTQELKPLFDFFLPEFYLSRETTVGINLLNDEVQSTLSSELAAYGNNIIRNLQGRFVTEHGRILADFDADKVQAGSFNAENVRLDALSDSVTVDLQASFHNEDGSGHRANLHTLFTFLDKETDGYRLRADILPSELAVAGNVWELLPATLLYRDNEITLDNFAIQNGEQSLLADGVIGQSRSDTVRVMLNYFDLGLANSFISTPMNLQGLLTGHGEAFALLSPDRGILLDMDGRRISAGGIDVGDLHLESHWDEITKQFNFLVDNALEGRHPLSAEASYRPSNKRVEMDMVLDRLEIGMLEPVLSSIVSDFGGSVSGHIKASGPLDKISVESEGTRLNELKLKLLYTQVDYILDGPFTINDRGVTFDDISVSDRFGHNGKITGGVPYDHFKDIRLNTRIELNNLLGLNTSLRDNETFYGRAFADGTVRLSGPLNNIRLSLNLTPKPNTSVHIPIGNSAKETKSLLTFIDREERIVGLFDSLIIAKQLFKQKKEKQSTSLSVNLRLNANPDAEILLEIDKNTGDILKARGYGQIGITVDGDNFDIKGDYKVDSGSYHFGMLGFTSRDFTINPGGTITFGGDVMQSDLDLTANYRAKASISPLIADSTAVTTRRVVDCGIRLSGKLSNPEISFNIDIPDLDPTTQSRVQGALNTEDKRMKQALALLISGGFVPDEQSGIVNSTTMLYSNASEMMASQLNNIFRQLDIPIDLGFNYQPTETGRDIFDVAVSTQLFNNRVIINGNIGNRQYMTSSNSDIVGDIDIEIKLNRQGQLRLTLLSHSADQYSNYLDQSQRNGAGIVYQEDFNTFGELWRKIFHIKSDESQTVPYPDPSGRPRPE